MMTTHHEARALAQNALGVVYHQAPSLTSPVVACLAGVASLETSYGDGWKGAGRGSNNMGAIQCGGGWTGGRFSYTDTHPNTDGTSTPYRVDFRAYPTPLEGWVDLVRTVYVNRGRAKVLAAAQAGDVLGVSRALHDTGYYEGYGKTVEDRVQNHYRALSRAIAAADAVQAPRVPVAGDLPALRRGAVGEDVRLLQRELHLVADGILGAVTERAVMDYQSEHGLTADGVCGPRTWGVLLADDYTPPEAA